MPAARIDFTVAPNSGRPNDISGVARGPTPASRRTTAATAPAPPRRTTCTRRSRARTSRRPPPPRPRPPGSRGRSTARTSPASW
jgi:hypothetical protein